MPHLYILKSLTSHRFYIGSTDNWKRRLKEHNSGQSTYTKSTKPFKIVFLKSYPTLKDALQTEMKLKKLKSRKIIERIVEEQEIRIG